MNSKYKKDEVIEGLIDFIKDSPFDDLSNKLTFELKKTAREEEEAARAYIYSVKKIDSEFLISIKNKLERLFNKKITVREIIQPELIGGLKIKVGDWVYDASVRSELNNIKKDLYAAA